MNKRKLVRSWCQWASIQFLDEFPTEWKSMVEYLRNEKIICWDKRKHTRKEIDMYNKWIQTAIQMIWSCATQLKDISKVE